MNKGLGTALYSRVSSPTVPAPFLASLVTRTAVLHISEECGVSPCLWLWRNRSPGDDGRMSGHNGTSGGGDLQLSRGHQRRSQLPLHSAICTFAQEVVVGGRVVIKEKQVTFLHTCLGLQSI